MLIRSMHLEHYRCFENFDIDFDDRLTVLVGVNGAGKTAALDALSIFLKIASQWDISEDIVYKFPLEDVTIGYELEDMRYRLNVQARNNDAKKIMQMDVVCCYVSKDDVFELGNGDSKVSNKQHMELRLNNSQRDFMTSAADNMVFAAYMAERSISEEDSIMSANSSVPSANPANIKNFNRKIDFASTLSWFNFADADEARAMRDSGQKDELPELRAVREALTKALLDRYERPRMLGNPPELVIYEKSSDRAYKISQLSDGYRSMLAMVMDLARRLAQSSSNCPNHSGSSLDAPAIVLIDEIELHLHPSWQQTVLTTLMAIFTNTQFVVTTHSPQVLTSIPPKHIRVLSDGKAYTVDEQTQGAEASRLLKHIFNVDLRPNSLEIVRNLKDYTELVYDEQWDTDRALKLRDTLVEHFGQDDPMLMELDLHIENCKWERGL